jgi:hypothetical protein
MVALSASPSPETGPRVTWGITGKVQKTGSNAVEMRRLRCGHAAAAKVDWVSAAYRRCVGVGLDVCMVVDIGDLAADV